MNKFFNETLCLICAKGNSQGLKNKNIKKINKKTLIEIAFKKAEQNKLKFFCLSTESQKIRKIANLFGLRSFFTRSKYLTKANISKLDVWKDALIKSEKFYNKKFKYILDIEVTNPLTTKKDLNDFIKFFLNNINKTIDGCLCVHESKKNPYFTILKSTEKGLKIFIDDSKKNIFSRQKAPKTYDHIGAFYILKRNYLLNTKRLFDGNLIGFNIDFDKTIDIDTINDFKIVKKLSKNEK